MIARLERHAFVLVLGAAIAATAFDLLWLGTLHYRVPLADFFVYYLAAKTGVAHGWTAMYDPATFLPAVTTAVGRPLPYLNPPELAWLVLPLSWLPYGIAASIWGVLLIGALAATWFIGAPGRGESKVAHLPALATVLPVFVSVLIGQVSLIVVAAVALAWWLHQRRRPWLAGAALSLIVLKPQLAFLVPLALLVAGHGRVFLGWLVATFGWAMIALAATGVSVVPSVAESLARVHGIPGPVQLSIERQLPLPIAAIVMVLVAATSVIVIRRRWAGDASTPFAIGLLSSVLLSPYINFYDLSGPVLAAWLVLRTNPPRWHRAAIYGLYVPLYLAPIWPVLTLAALIAWLVSLLALRPPQAAIQPAGAVAA